MKNCLFLIYLMFVFVSISVAQKNLSDCENRMDFLKRTDRYAFSYVGSVKSIQINETNLDAETPREMKITLKFDDKGKLAETFLSTTKIPKFGRTIYLYDQADRINKKTSFNPDGSAVFEYVYTYDAEGKLASKVTQNAVTKRVIGSKTEYKYEASDTYVEYSDGKFVRRIKLLRNQKCQIVDRILTKANGQLENKLSVKYDERNNVIEHIAYSPTGNPAEKLKWEYEYDNRGNWIKMSSYEWHYWDKTDSYTLTSVETRTITYRDSK